MAFSSASSSVLLLPFSMAAEQTGVVIQVEEMSSDTEDPISAYEATVSHVFILEGTQAPQGAWPVNFDRARAWARERIGGISFRKIAAWLGKRAAMALVNWAFQTVGTLLWEALPF